MTHPRQRGCALVLAYALEDHLGGRSGAKWARSRKARRTSPRPFASPRRRLHRLACRRPPVGAERSRGLLVEGVRFLPCTIPELITIEVPTWPASRRDSHVGRVHPQIGDERLAEAAHGEFRGAVGSVGPIGADRREDAVDAARIDDVALLAAINIPGTFSCPGRRRPSRWRTCAPRGSVVVDEAPRPGDAALLNNRLIDVVTCSLATASRKASSWVSSATSATNVLTRVPAGPSRGERSRLLERRRRDVTGRHVTTGLRQLAYEFSAHSRATARDDGDPSSEVLHGLPCLSHPRSRCRTVTRAIRFSARRSRPSSLGDD